MAPKAFAHLPSIPPSKNVQIDPWLGNNLFRPLRADSEMRHDFKKLCLEQKEQGERSFTLPRDSAEKQKRSLGNVVLFKTRLECP